MTTLVWNILLALIWAVALGPPTAFNLLVGFVVGYGALGLAWRLGLGPDGPEGPTYFRRVLLVASFVLFFVREMINANLKMAYYTLSPLSRLRPGIVAFDVSGMSDLEITTLSNVVTLTPGVMSLDVSKDRSRLIVHCMDASDPERIKQGLRDGFQRRILEIMR